MLGQHPAKSSPNFRKQPNGQIEVKIAPRRSAPKSKRAANNGPRATSSTYRHRARTLGAAPRLLPISTRRRLHLAPRRAACPGGPRQPRQMSLLKVSTAFATYWSSRRLPKGLRQCPVMGARGMGKSSLVKATTRASMLTGQRKAAATQTDRDPPGRHRQFPARWRLHEARHTVSSCFATIFRSMPKTRPTSLLKQYLKAASKGGPTT